MRTHVKSIAFGMMSLAAGAAFSSSAMAGGRRQDNPLERYGWVQVSSLRAFIVQQFNAQCSYRFEYTDAGGFSNFLSINRIVRGPDGVVTFDTGDLSMEGGDNASVSLLSSLDLAEYRRAATFPVHVTHLEAQIFLGVPNIKSSPNSAFLAVNDENGYPVYQDMIYVDAFCR